MKLKLGSRPVRTSAEVSAAPAPFPFGVSAHLAHMWKVSHGNWVIIHITRPLDPR